MTTSIVSTGNLIPDIGAALGLGLFVILAIVVYVYVQQPFSKD